MLFIAKRVWALPWTLVGLAIGLVGLATGGDVRRSFGTLGFSGGATRVFLRLCPVVRGASAMAPRARGVGADARRVGRGL